MSAGSRPKASRPCGRCLRRSFLVPTRDRPRDGVFYNYRRDAVALVNAARLPAIYPEGEYADDGGLMAYGTNVADNFRRAASYVDRILKGARPGDLPIQEPVKFDFVVNLKTAKDLGFTIPACNPARADEVIE